MIATSSLVTSDLDLAAQRDAFRGDVLRGLSARHKWLPCKYFYDEAGSRLFEQITRLPEYYLTRTELAIMQKDAADMAAHLGSGCLLIEYGSGSSVKTRLLLRHLDEPAGYIPIDIAREQLRQAADALALDYSGLDIQPLCADFTAALELPGITRGVRRRVVYFPGSTLGNFTPAESIALLRRTAALCGPDGGMLLGVDLKKDPRVIEQAYNDRQFITAAFNRNLLTRINRELGGNFQVEQFWHHALYNPVEGRIEMHLVSQGHQQLHIGSQEIVV
ncbi:MAG TPA: L-histidine N(alpha)-methyltransferase, partial [Gemmataceae bacterium]|nr:L-histidine N(alpha)-methyltransferase [Gemmataceae bacterium]